MFSPVARLHGTFLFSIVADSGSTATPEGGEEGSNGVKAGQEGSNGPRQSDKCTKKCEKEVEGGEKIFINCKNCKLAGCCDKCCKNGGNFAVYSGMVDI